MHSVVIIGDIRTHLCSYSDDVWKPKTKKRRPLTDVKIHEGAYFMQRAIEQILPCLTEALGDKLKAAEAILETAKTALKVATENTARAKQEADDSAATAKQKIAGGSSCDDQLRQIQVAVQVSIVKQHEHLQATRAQAKLKQEETDAESCVNKLKQSTTAKTRVFGLTFPDKTLQLDGKPLKWELKLTSIPDDKRPVGRMELGNSENSTDYHCPLISPALLGALQLEVALPPGSSTYKMNAVHGDLPQGSFESAHTPANSYQVKECPDVVVFEDRGQDVVRKLPFTDDDEMWIGKQANDLIERIHDVLVNNKSDDDLKAAIDGGSNNTKLHIYLQEEVNAKPTLLRSICQRIVMQWGMVNLFRRMNLPATKSAESYRPIMEPVIICSIMGNVQTVIGEHPNVYSRILENDWLRERTIAVLDAEDLRNGDQPLAISSGLSWERTVQETIVELKRSAGHAKLLRFGQLIVRYGVTGALHIVRRADGQHSFTLYFDVRNDDAEWSDEKLQTTMFGRAAVFVASLIQSLAVSCIDREGHPFLQELAHGVSEAMRSSIGRCQGLARISFGRDLDEFKKLCGNHWLPEGLFRVPLPATETTPDPTSAIFECVDVPSVVLRSWSILGQSAEAHLGKLASRIVRLGPEVIILGKKIIVNGKEEFEFPTTPAPVIRYGTKDKPSTYVVDRREVEGYRAIEKVIRAHLETERKRHRSSDEPRPLSIAVFGPPGSGKSTAVQRIIDKVSEEGDNSKSIKRLDPFNLSQFSDTADIRDAFAKIGNVRSPEIPIAFFDEFDGNVPGDDKPLGWLKYFLSPMEDGLFKETKLGSAILVFAGGTASTFSEFSLEGRSKTDEQWLQFGQAKGPDFVSRLRAHLNIIGINPADPEDELYLIRRAIFVHAILKKMQDLNDGEDANIDDAMVRAVLHVPEYRHGGRSLKMLLQSCADASGRISISAVPPMHQLNMLVDGKAFAALLANLSATLK